MLWSVVTNMPKWLWLDGTHYLAEEREDHKAKHIIHCGKCSSCVMTKVISEFRIGNI